MISKSKGMTLIEVLIASILLFIAISIMSFTFQSKVFAEKKLQESIRKAYLLEQVKGVAAYSVEFENKLQGNLGDGYYWQAEIINSLPVVRTINVDRGLAPDGTMQVFRVSIFIKSNSKSILSYEDFYWKKSES
ncbi:hypothetical protein GBO14_18260 [Pseudoalteromonas shioyasakiensis]|uniref:type II secretion system protein n=1 Tax=Pseudoalteromonas shioyasakiensis TaxID=1190813 RepID=UPI00209660F8|nr:type II secretion system protein [Pseudoalteromonas shioyasakiensis]MCO6356667.1 hypothetical protein [Pseudoalteromonas shioyasakiensis]